MAAAFSIYIGFFCLVGAVWMLADTAMARWVWVPWFGSLAALSLGGWMLWSIRALPAAERTREPLPLIRRQAWIGTVLGAIALAAAWAVVHRAAQSPPPTDENLRRIPTTVKPLEK